MYRKLTFLAILMASFPVFSANNVSLQHTLTDNIMAKEAESYVIITAGEDVHVITYGYKTPSETCKFLKNKGINIVNVTDYVHDDNNVATGEVLEKDC